jgi:hypothetical protein
MEIMETTTNTQSTDDNLGPAQIFERTRDQLKTWSTARLDDIQTRATTLTDRRDDLRKQGKDLLKQGEQTLNAGRDALLDRKAELLRQKEEATRMGRDTLLSFEATALEGARDLLVRAGELAGPKATFLTRGRAALDDAIVSVRATYEGGLPVNDFDLLSIAKITPQLDGLSVSELKTLAVYEAANKNRKTLLRELNARIDEFAPAHTAEA